MNKIFITTNSLLALLGLFFFNWNPVALFLFYVFENFILAFLTIYTVKKQGGSSLLVKYLPVDIEFYNDQLITRTKRSSPLLGLGFSLIGFNILVVIMSFGFFKLSDLIFIYYAFFSIIGLAINYLIANKKFLPLDSEEKLLNYLSRPFKSIFTIYYGFVIGMSFFIIAPFPIIIAISIVTLRLITELIVEKYNSPMFNKRLMILFGFKLKGIK